MSTAMAMLIAPATIPLREAMAMASLAEIFRVRLLSIAQQRHAPAISSAPREIPNSPGVHESMSPPMTMRAMPAAMRQSKFSRNTNHANRAVNTASRLSSSELTDAAVDVS